MDYPNHLMLVELGRFELVLEEEGETPGEIYKPL